MVFYEVRKEMAEWALNVIDLFKHVGTGKDILWAGTFALCARVLYLLVKDTAL